MTFTLELKLIPTQQVGYSTDEIVEHSKPWTTTVGEEKISYYIVPQTALSDICHSKIGYSDSDTDGNSRVFVSKHISPVLAPFVAMHLAYNQMDTRELEKKWGLDDGFLNSLGRDARRDFILTGVLTYATDVLRAGDVSSLIDLYEKDSELAPALDDSVFEEIRAAYGGRDCTAIALQMEKSLEYYVERVEAKANAHHHNQYVKRSRGSEAISHHYSGRIGNLFNSGVSGADFVMRPLRQEMYTVGSEMRTYGQILPGLVGLARDLS